MSCRQFSMYTLMFAKKYFQKHEIYKHKFYILKSHRMKFDDGR